MLTSCWVLAVCPRLFPASVHHRPDLQSGTQPLRISLEIWSRPAAILIETQFCFATCCFFFTPARQMSPAAIYVFPLHFLLSWTGRTPSKVLKLRKVIIFHFFSPAIRENLLCFYSLKMFLVWPPLQLWVQYKKMYYMQLLHWKSWTLFLTNHWEKLPSTGW